MFLILSSFLLLLNLGSSVYVPSPPVRYGSPATPAQTHGLTKRQKTDPNLAPQYYCSVKDCCDSKIMGTMCRDYTVLLGNYTHNGYCGKGLLDNLN